MPVEIVRRKPTTRMNAERLRISLMGDHSLDGAGCMLLQVVAFLHDMGFTHFGGGDLYLALIDRDHHPLTRFPDGSPVRDHVLTIRSPYDCAADKYDLKFPPPPPRPF